jgi:phosphohistidine phosphatase SixA/8-oxo-dGTP pyrophosphatase MutT (NUDIX family)
LTIRPHHDTARAKVAAPVAPSRYGVGVDKQHRGTGGPSPVDDAAATSPHTGTGHRGTAVTDEGADHAMRTPPPSRSVLAAGGVLWRTAVSGTVEVVGIYRPSCDNWSLPKGKLDVAEHRLAGACREVEEETGLTPIPQNFLTTAQYRLSHPDGDITKTVDFWAMRAMHPAAEFIPNDEVTKHRWMPLDEAFTTLTRPRDQQALQAFTARPLVTATVVLLRHAQAQPLSAFHGIDVTRPLDARGRGQAAHLVPLLALYNPQRIVTATPQRCVNTVSPLAAALGLKVDGESIFDEEAHLRNPERAAQRLREFAASQTSVVVCSQAPVIADSLAILADTDGVTLSSVHTPVGGVWVLSFTHKVLAAAERL